MGMAIRAKTYQNRKGDKKMQVSLDQTEAKKLAAGDEDITAEFKKAVTEALKK